MPKEIKKPEYRKWLRLRIMEEFGSYSVAELNTGIDTATLSRLVNGHRDPTDLQIAVLEEYGIKFE